MTAILYVRSGPMSGRRFELVERKNVLGRHPDCDITIEVGAVSRRHAQVVCEDDSYYIEDLKSRNGTLLNDKPLSERTKLSDGDEVRVCDVTFTYVCKPKPGVGFFRRADEASGFSTVLVDDDTSSSTIMSKLDVSYQSGTVQVSAAPEVKLAALVEITQNLGQALSLDDVLPQVLHTLFKIFVQADRGFIVLKNDAGELVVKWSEVRREDVGETIRLSRTIARQVMETKEAILSADAATDKRFDMSQSIADFRIRSMMCAPLLDSEGEAIGMLQIDTLDQRNRFEAGDLELLASIAVAASSAIDKARLHDEALQQLELQRDLALAHEVQRSFLPEKAPALPDYEFYDYYEPAEFIGGDYFDYIPLADGRVAVFIADVVGHGVAAALMMVKLLVEARGCLSIESDPARALTLLNQRMGGLQNDRFVTGLLAVIDPKTNEVAIANAGHMIPIVRRGDGSTEEIGDDEVGLPLSVADDFEYESCTCQLGPGDMMLLYTDGLNEAMNEAGELFGDERIHKLMADGPPNAAELGANVVSSVRQYIGAGRQFDDMCIVCFGRTGET